MAPDSVDLRRVADDLVEQFSRLPDESWDRPALGLTWSCRETAAHLNDDFGFYAMQLSGTTPPLDDYVDLVDPPPWTKGGPQIVFWPDPDKGTAGIVRCLDAAAGLLVAVTATAPAEKRGFHPRGVSDASGFAAMGIVEATLHAWDILSALGVVYAADAVAVSRSLDRLFPDAPRTDNPWQDLLKASGRTPETRGKPWTWDSSVRDDHRGKPIG